MENENKALIQSFYTQLAQQLEILHSVIEVSVKKQQKQLKDIEINTDYFVSDKDKVNFFWNRNCAFIAFTGKIISNHHDIWIGN